MLVFSTLQRMTRLLPCATTRNQYVMLATDSRSAEVPLISPLETGLTSAKTWFLIRQDKTTAFSSCLLMGCWRSIGQTYCIEMSPGLERTRQGMMRPQSLSVFSSGILWFATIEPSIFTSLFLALSSEDMDRNTPRPNNNIPGLKTLLLLATINHPTNIVRGSYT